MNFWWIYPIAGSFLLSLIFTEIIRIFAIRFDIVDRPNAPRKLHKLPVPLLGGIAIFLAISIIVLVILWQTNHLTSGLMNSNHFLGYLAGGCILMIGGALDDRFNLRARYSIIFPFFAVLVAVMAGIGVSKITNPLGGALYVLPWVSMLLSFLWLMGMTYTTKLLDGLDGLATGVSAIAVFIIGILALTQTYYQPDAALFAFVIFAALIGFLLWNFYPAQIFLGESGSTFIGYSIGVLAIIAGGKMATALLVLGIPALDIIFVIVDRARMKQPLFAGDRRHLHHKLLDIGLSQKGVVFLYYGIAMIVGITSLMFESIGKILAFFVLFIIMVIGTFFVSRLKKNYVI